MKKITDKKKLARVIATWLITGIMVSVFVLDIITVILANKYVSQTNVEQFSYKKSSSADRIYFLNTANSDCILIESNGKFALVDSGEGNKNPRRKTEYKGYRDEVLSYIKKLAGDENGNVFLDFIVVTHLHYDHAGNFAEIINDKDIKIGKAFIKKYTTESFTETESEGWGNFTIYKDIMKALKGNKIEIVHNIPEKSFIFGDFEITFINCQQPVPDAPGGDNTNSIGVKLKKGNKSAFLAADITNSAGLEEKYANEIGDIDLLKIGHHGYYGSSSAKFLKTVKPEITICTNYIGKIYPNVKWNLTMVAKAAIFSTEHCNGIVADFKNDTIDLYENI